MVEKKYMDATRNDVHVVGSGGVSSYSRLLSVATSRSASSQVVSSFGGGD